MAKRVGRGYGSGKGGHTSSRGQKGQKTRNKMHILFEGVKVKKSTLKRLPLLRGKGKMRTGVSPVAIGLDSLNVFDNGEKVSLESLVKKGVVKESGARKYGVKVLDRGKLEKKLEVYLETSKSAAEKITKAGGKVV